MRLHHTTHMKPAMTALWKGVITLYNRPENLHEKSHYICSAAPRSAPIYQEASHLPCEARGGSCDCAAPRAFLIWRQYPCMHAMHQHAMFEAQAFWHTHSRLDARRQQHGCMGSRARGSKSACCPAPPHVAIPWPMPPWPMPPCLLRPGTHTHTSASHLMPWRLL